MGGFVLSPEDRARIESDPELFYYRFLLQRHFPPLYMNALINPPAQGVPRHIQIYLTALANTNYAQTTLLPGQQAGTASNWLRELACALPSMRHFSASFRHRIEAVMWAVFLGKTEVEVWTAVFKALIDFRDLVRKVVKDETAGRCLWQYLH